jgi:hypothetical protein
MYTKAEMKLITRQAILQRELAVIELKLAKKS